VRFFAFASIVLCAGTISARPLPSDVIFPSQKMPLTFSHAKHLAKKIGCDFCHEKAPKSHNAADNLIPDEEVCSTCHDIDRAKPTEKQCATCHPGWKPGVEVARVTMPAPFLKFDHKIHVDKKVACTRCHGDLSKVELADRAQLPQMELCLGCHDSRKAPLHAASRCTTCHLSKYDGTLETRFPTGNLVPSGTLRGDAHTLTFRTDHKAVARDDEGYCMSCHRRDFCQSCHNGVVKPFDFHGNDYVSRHPIDARRNDPDCSSCHRRQSFCLGCHERLGVVDRHTGQDGAFRPFSTRSFHPEGWADPVASGQPNHHAWQAQRNLKQCVSCHRQETCLECHASKTGAAGASSRMEVNPHPANWRGSARCNALASRNLRMCLQCHAPNDSQLSCQ
jgi:c(7)-type cytochrome triheme protein